jgi:hypothetical protein
MATRYKNFGRVFVHTNDTFGNFEDFQGGNIDVGDNFDVGGPDLVKCLDIRTRNHLKVVGANFVKEAFLANIFRKFAV